MMDLRGGGGYLSVIRYDTSSTYLFYLLFCEPVLCCPVPEACRLEFPGLLEYEQQYLAQMTVLTYDAHTSVSATWLAV
jgi:hypothetical protein